MNFQKNDRFQVKENGLTGTVVDTNVEFTFYKTGYDLRGAYTVKWDHWHNEGVYMSSDVDDLWEKISQIADAQILSGPGKGYVNQDPDVLPKGNDTYRYKVEYVYADEKKQCEHKWVEVGFMHTKIVCYHCDMEKP